MTNVKKKLSKNFGLMFHEDVSRSVPVETVRLYVQ